MRLQQALMRALEASTNRSFRGFGRGSAHFGTDIGLRRGDNQDRVAVASWNSHPASNLGAMCAIVVSDGMGGMQDGAHCAALTASHFLADLIVSRKPTLRDAVRNAAFKANEGVYEAYRSRGGATLSAVIVSGARAEAVGINVGDSRIYSPSLEPANELLRLLTVDDNLKSFGGSGNELLQFIGMGSGVEPHLVPIGNDDIVTITTDGAHFFDSAIFSQIVLKAPDAKAITERLIALSRWLGAPDNATVGVLDVARTLDHLSQGALYAVDLSTPSTEGSIYLIDPDEDITLNSVQRSLRSAQSGQIDRLPSDTPRPASKTPRKKKAVSKKKQPEQLSIDVEVMRGDSPDADSQ